MSPVDLFFILAGPFIGSFIGLLAFRWPEGEPWLAKRSACRNCATTLRWFELVPVISWIALRGRCRSCGATISAFYAACEILALAVPVTAYLFAPEGTYILSCLMGWTLLALAAIDWRSFILPDGLNLLLAALGGGMIVLHARSVWPEHLIGGLAGFGLLFLVETFYRQTRGREGLGRGDAKLLGALGLWTGWMQLPDILLIASLSGLAAALAASMLSKERLSGSTALAFGPWLALAGWISWLSGPLLVP
ncbi:MAG: A24 family peptidase, partial [Henriciella sp.]|uniref:prepilin peptidase n=1 Tax=Henriciella sp. TaxID=1968823 RepID=UPI003C77BF50